MSQRRQHRLAGSALETAGRSATQAVGTIEVRLVLHVLRPFVQEQRLLNEFWRTATVSHCHPWSSCHLPYRAIVMRLLDLGVEVDDASRP